MRIAAGILMAASAASAFADPTPRRDPTVPPAAYGAQAQSPMARPAFESFRPEHIVIVDGKRYLVWRGHRYGVGDSVQGARIERLDENEVWLRSGEGVRKLAMFPGIRKTPAEVTKGPTR